LTGLVVKAVNDTVPGVLAARTADVVVSGVRSLPCAEAAKPYTEPTMTTTAHSGASQLALVYAPWISCVRYRLWERAEAKYHNTSSANSARLMMRATACSLSVLVMA